MKNRTCIREIESRLGEKAIVAGFVEKRRDHGKLIFLDIRDRTGVMQAVSSGKNPDVHRAVELLRGEWVVSLKGVVNKRPEKMVNPEMETGGIELLIQEARVLGRAKELPFEKEERLNLDTYLDHLPLTLRTERGRAIFTVQARIVRAFREFLLHEDFTEIQPPKIIGEDAEGGASVFDVSYFAHTAHLAQSPQFYKQIMVGVFERVFAAGNVFRAEKHSTARHLNEYTSLDIEMGFIDDHRDVMALTDRLMAHITWELGKNCAKEFSVLGAELPAAPDEIPSLKLREAQEIIRKEHGDDCVGEPDLAPQHERWIGEYSRREHGSDFIYITHFPVEKRPMYIYEDEDDPGCTKSFDLLFRGLEAATGGQRIHDYDALVRSIIKKGLDPAQFAFYLQAFRYGMPPHGGFGMGLERLTARFLGIENVKEATLFPREINRIDTLLSE